MKGLPIPPHTSLLSPYHFLSGIVYFRHTKITSCSPNMPVLYSPCLYVPSLPCHSPHRSTVEYSLWQHSGEGQTHRQGLRLVLVCALALSGVLYKYISSLYISSLSLEFLSVKQGQSHPPLTIVVRTKWGNACQELSTVPETEGAQKPTALVDLNPSQSPQMPGPPLSHP